MNTDALERLRVFRQQVYTIFGCRRDALVEMLDVLLTTPVIEHPVHLSLAPGFQRTWGSIYNAQSARHDAAVPVGVLGGSAAAGGQHRLVCGQCQRLAPLRCRNES